MQQTTSNKSSSNNSWWKKSLSTRSLQFGKTVCCFSLLLVFPCSVSSGTAEIWSRDPADSQTWWFSTELVYHWADEVWKEVCVSNLNECLLCGIILAGFVKLVSVQTPCHFWRLPSRKPGSLWLFRVTFKMGAKLSWQTLTSSRCLKVKQRLKAVRIMAH